MATEYQKITDLSSMQYLSVPEGTIEVWLQADTQNVRYVLDGTNQRPSATRGMRLLTDAAPTVLTYPPVEFGKVVMIEEVAGAMVNITYCQVGVGEESSLSTSTLSTTSQSSSTSTLSVSTSSPSSQTSTETSSQSTSSLSTTSQSTLTTTSETTKVSSSRVEKESSTSQKEMSTSTSTNSCTSIFV